MGRRLTNLMSEHKREFRKILTLRQVLEPEVKITHKDIRLYELTTSPSRFFPFFRKLAKLLLIRVFHYRDFIDGKFRMKLLVIGPWAECMVYDLMVSQFLRGIHKDLDGFSGKNFVQAILRKIHLSEFKTNELSRMINQLCEWVDKLEEVKSEYPFTKDIQRITHKKVLITKYYQENIKHKHLKHELRYK